MAEKSFLRWAGSKQKLVPRLKEFWNPDSSRYVEPFMGSAQLFFSIQPKEALLSDTNFELVETFNQVKKNPYPIYKILKTYKATKQQYYALRKINPVTLGINQRVARFIFLNKLCFNGLYRTNVNGQFNVPYAAGNKFCPDEIIEVLQRARKLLEFATIKEGDFEKVVKRNLRHNDFVYLDPPYAVGNRRIFRQYGPHSFGLDDLQRLSELLNTINDRGAQFLLSYAYCPEAIQMFEGWHMIKTFTQRNISGFAQYRRKAAEILVTNLYE